jgi:hypothetical protein
VLATKLSEVDGGVARAEQTKDGLVKSKQETTHVTTNLRDAIYVARCPDAPTTPQNQIQVLVGRTSRSNQPRECSVMLTREAGNARALCSAKSRSKQKWQTPSSFSSSHENPVVAPQQAQCPSAVRLTV